MSEHLLFLQAAGSDFHAAHDLVAAVAEVTQSPQGEPGLKDIAEVEAKNSKSTRSQSNRRPVPHPERLAERIKRAGYEGTDSLLVALAVLATTASPLSDADINWIASVATRVKDGASLQEIAGVVFAFNTINRIADARRVRLEYRFLRELRPIQGWVERCLASITAMAYDLSFKYQSRCSGDELLDRLGAHFERLGIPVMPDVFHWLSRSPVVLEGVIQMIESNFTTSRVRPELLKEAVAIGVASRAMPGSGLRTSVEQWLPTESLSDSQALRAWAAPSGVASNSDLILACRRYCWQTANAAYAITEEQIGNLIALGLSDAEVLDLTIATAAFSALAIIEPISAAGSLALLAQENLPSAQTREVHVQPA